MKIDQFLYRGVNEEIHNRGEGLKPHGCSFLTLGGWQEASHRGWSGSGWDTDKNSAVLNHQRGVPTAGVSTTPFFDRATFYATHNGKYKKGFIYKIDRTLLQKFFITEYVVSKFINNPEIPQDGEVILVDEGEYASLPQGIVIETFEIDLSLNGSSHHSLPQNDHVRTIHP